MSTASTQAASHIRNNINPLIKQDVNHFTLGVPCQKWVEATTGVSFNQFQRWSHTIFEQRWFNDRPVAAALKKFCDATHETARYDPFSEIADHILAKARKQLAGVPEEYPISDLKFFCNDPTCLQVDDKHGKIGAKRKLDVLCLRNSVSHTIKRSTRKSPPGAKWSSVLLFAGFRFDGRKNIRATLDNAFKERPQRPSKKQGHTGTEKGTKPKRGRTRREQDTSVMLATPISNSYLTSEELTGDPSPTRQGKKRMYDELSAEELYSSGPSKRSKTHHYVCIPPEQEATIHAASYALEVLSCTNGTRIYDLGLVFNEDELTMWYYDASGLVKTQEKLSLIDDFEDVAAVLISLACCDASRWGAMPVFQPPEESSYPESFPPADLSGYTVDLRHPDTQEKVRLHLERPLFSQYALVGRRTFVYEATTTHEALKDRTFVVKFSQQVKSGRPEQHLIKVARDSKVGNLPDVLFADDIWSLSDGPRRILHLSLGGELPYDDRVLRAIVCQKYIPLQKALLEHPEYFEIMIPQILQCLHDLRFKAKILHRDVSVNNIMFELRDGKPYFILNDFDLATVVSDTGEPTGATSNHRTGTLPFMAFELLYDMTPVSIKSNRVAHQLRHDFESFFWSSAWCTSRVERVADPALQDLLNKSTIKWETGELYDIATAKQDFLIGSEPLATLPMSPSFAKYRNLLDQWRAVHSASVAVRLSSHSKIKGLMGGLNLDDLINLEQIMAALELEDPPAGFAGGSYDAELDYTRTLSNTLIAGEDAIAHTALNGSSRSTDTTAQEAEQSHSSSLLHWLRLPASIFKLA